MKIELTKLKQIELTAETAQDVVWLEQFCVELYKHYPDISSTYFVTDQDETSLDKLVKIDTDKSLWCSLPDDATIILNPWTRTG